MTQIGELFVKIGARLDGLNKGLSDAERSIQRTGKNMEKVGKNLTMKVTLPLLAIGVAAIKMGADFEQSMMNAASVSGATAAELEQMKNVAREMGETTVFSAKQAADAMYFMASAGWKAHDMAVAIKPTLDLAAATQSDLAFATETVVSSLNQFGLKSKDAERVSNVFAAAIGASQATLLKLSESMVYVGPIAASMGKSVEETTSVLMALYNAGFTASMAGTALRMAIAKMIKPTQETTKALRRLGLGIEDINPTTHKFADIIGILGERGANTKDIIEIFGVRAGPAMAALINQGSEAIKKFEKTITGTDAASRMAEMQIDTLKGSFKLLTSVLTEAAIQISGVLIPIVRNLVDNHIKPAIQRFTGLSDATKKIIISVAGLAAAIGPLLFIMGKLLPVMFKVTLAFKAMRTAVIASSFAHVAETGAMVRVVSKGRLLGNSISMLANRFKGLSIAIVAVAWVWLQKQIEKTTKTMANFFSELIGIEGAQSEMARLVAQNKNEIKNLQGVLEVLTPTTEELRKEIEKGAESWQLYRMQLVKADKMLIANKKSAELLAKFEDMITGYTEANRDAIRAKTIALSAFNQDLKGYIENERKRLDILGKTDKEIKTHIDKIKKSTKANDLYFIAHDKVSKALKHGTDLTRKQKDALKKLLEQLENQISKMYDAEHGAEALNDLFKELGITTKDKLVKEFKNLGTILKNNTTLQFLTTEEVKKLKKRYDELRASLKNIKPVFVTTNTTLEISKKLFGDIAKVALNSIGSIGKVGNAFDRALGPILAKVVNIKKPLEDTFGVFKNVGKWADVATKELKENTDKIKKIITDVAKKIKVDWEGVAKSMMDFWGNALAAMIKDGINFADLLSATWQSVAIGVGNALGQVVASLGPVGAAVSGLVSAVATAAISAIGKLLGIKSKAEKEAEAAARQAKAWDNAIKHTQTLLSGLGKISKETSEALNEMSRSMKGYIAVDKIFAQIISEVGINQDNVNTLWKRATDILQHMKNGEISAADATKSLDESFKLLLEGTQKLGQEGSAAMVEFIVTMREAGVEIVSVTEYVVSQLNRIPESLEAMIEKAGKNEIALQNMATIALESFNSMIASGMSYNEAITAMQGPLAALKDKYADLGIEGNAALEALFKVIGVTEEHKKLFDAIEANRNVMEALGNTGFLTQESFKAITDQARAYYRQLIKAGVDADTAMKMMGPTWQAIQNQADTYGFSIDKNTQKFIDQAKDMGLVSEAQKTDQEAQKENFQLLADRMAEIMDNLANKIGGFFKTAFSDVFTDAETQASTSVNKIGQIYKKAKIKIPFEFAYTGQGGGDGGGGGGGDGGYADEGVAWQPQMAYLAERHNPEAIVDLRKFAMGQSKFSGVLDGQGGAGKTIHNTFNINALDGADVERVVTHKIMPILDRTYRDNIGGSTRNLSKEVRKYF